MQFRDIKASDIEWAKPLLEAAGPISCEYAFGNIFMWSRVFKTQIARWEDFCLTRGVGSAFLYYLYPQGPGDKRAAVEAILRDAHELGKEAVLYSIPKDEAEVLEGWFPGHFTITNPRDQADYIYDPVLLATLPGKKYQKKRNHCSRFERSYPDWGFYEISSGAMDALVAFNKEWANLYDNRDDKGIAAEHEAIALALSQYEALGFKGGYITTGGRIVAFSYGSPMGDIFVTHVEKGLYDVPGTYPMINREMARRYGTGFRYINRENDVDEEGLRAAKLSYHPAFLEEKLQARWHP